MRILLFSNLYEPEPTGVGPYSHGLAASLVERGHEVTVITATPSYPHWKRFEGYPALRWTRSIKDGVVIHRCPVFVPRKVSGAKRILHYGSFVASAVVPSLWLARRFKPNVVILVAPTLLATPAALAAARLAGAASWLHIQDFEVEAGFATGQMNGNDRLARFALAFERRCISSFDQTSAISPEMCSKLIEKGRSPDTVHEFRNWAEMIDVAAPGDSSLRSRWGVTTPHVALYSGSIAKKQGIEIIVDVARRLRDRQDVTFIICGNGPTRGKLEESARDLRNIRFFDLQPKEELSELLALATIHLLPQKADTADLVLPSKLTNMLASGRPVVATAHPGTGLARELETGGIVVPPEDPNAMACAVAMLIDEPNLRHKLGIEARNRAERVWNRQAIVDAFEQQLRKLRPL